MMNGAAGGTQLCWRFLANQGRPKVQPDSEDASTDFQPVGKVLLGRCPRGESNSALCGHDHDT